MENKRHTVYQSLNRKPKITGLSPGLFGIMMAVVVVVFLFIGASWLGLFGSVFVGFFFHGVLIKAEDKDDLFLLLWIGKIFKGDNHYQAKGPIDHTPSKKTKSISTFH